MQTPACIRILIAEDNIINQMLFTKMLSVLGCKADIADSGISAVTACQSQLYDVVFMDYQMPEGDGVEAAKSIKAAKQRSTPIIILMTANLLVHNDYLSHPGIIDDFLKKPFTLQDIKAILEKWQPAIAAQHAAK